MIRASVSTFRVYRSGMPYVIGLICSDTLAPLKPDT